MQKKWFPRLLLFVLILILPACGSGPASYTTGGAEKDALDPTAIRAKTGPNNGYVLNLGTIDVAFIGSSEAAYVDLDEYQNGGGKISTHPAVIFGEFSHYNSKASNIDQIDVVDGTKLFSFDYVGDGMDLSGTNSAAASVLVKLTYDDDSTDETTVTLVDDEWEHNISDLTDVIKIWIEYTLN